MGMKKAFFRERTMPAIRHMVLEEAGNPAGLVAKIEELDPRFEALLVKTRIMPKQFCATAKPVEGARNCYKYGNYISLKQPATLDEAICQGFDMLMFERSFEQMSHKNEPEIDYVGYSFRQIGGRGAKKLVPFACIPEALRIFVYAEKMTSGIKVRTYATSGAAATSGAVVICEIPSREAERGRYKIRLDHIPVVNNRMITPIALGVISTYAEMPENKLNEIRFSSAGHDIATFYPQEIAAYLAAAKCLMEKTGTTTCPNKVPIEACPFIIPSRRAANFYNKLCNNVIIYDEKAGNTSQMRKLYVAEKCILFGRAIGVLGLNEMRYLNSKRDGKIADYDWSIPQPEAVA